MENQLRVIRILNEYELVINAGTENGYKKGDCFNIYAKNKIVINCPDSGERLGELEVFKAKISIVTIHPKIAVCVNYSPPFGSLFNTSFRFDESHNEFLTDMNIHIGDIIIPIASCEQREDEEEESLTN